MKKLIATILCCVMLVSTVAAGTLADHIIEESTEHTLCDKVYNGGDFDGKDFNSGITCTQHDRILAFIEGAKKSKNKNIIKSGVVLAGFIGAIALSVKIYNHYTSGKEISAWFAEHTQIKSGDEFNKYLKECLDSDKRDDDITLIINKDFYNQ